MLLFHPTFNWACGFYPFWDLVKQFDTTGPTEKIVTHRPISKWQDIFPMWHFMSTLEWRQNGCDGVSNRPPHYCLLNRLFRHKSKKTPKLTATGLCVCGGGGGGGGIHRWPVNSPHKWPVTRKMFPFDDVTMDSASPALCGNVVGSGVSKMLNKQSSCRWILTQWY